jgi:hypothetical protein
MNSAEHVAQAIIHLEQAANANHDHLLLERRFSEWQQAVLASARASAAKSLLTEVHAVWNPPEETWTVPDFGHIRDLNGRNMLHDE